MKKLIRPIMVLFVLLSSIFVGGFSYAQEENSTTLLQGRDFVWKIKQLAGSNATAWDKPDSKIKHFEKAEGLTNKYTTGLLSAEGLPVYGRFDTGNSTLYYYTQASKIYMNSDSSSMFRALSGLESLDLSDFDTSNVTGMNQMFFGCKSLTLLDLSSFDTSKVKNMNGMFNGCSKLESLNLSSFVTSNVTDMSSMFYNCGLLTTLNLSNFNTSNVKDMQSMFNGCKNLTSLDLSSFDTSKVTTMKSMFNGCKSLTGLDLSSFNTSKVENMQSMFAGTSLINAMNLERIYVSDSFVTIKVTSGADMFKFDTKLKGGIDTAYDSSHVDVLYARIDEGSGSANPGYFTEKITPIEDSILLPGKEFNKIIKDLADGGTNTYSSIDNNIKSIKRIDIDELPSTGYTIVSMKGVVNPVFARYDDNTIYYSSESDTIYMNPESDYLFAYLSDLTEIDLSSFDTSKVTTMEGMFNSCQNLEELDVSSFDTSNVTDMHAMFNACRNLTGIDVSNFNTSKVTTMQSMFSDCERLEELDVSNFDTSNVTDMHAMFNACRNLTGIDVSNFNTSKVTTMQTMFYECRSLTNLNLSNFDTRNVTNMYKMFNGHAVSISNNLKTIDLSSFDTSKVEGTGMEGTFDNLPNLTTIYVSDTFTVEKLDNVSMFLGDVNLVGGNGTKFSDLDIDDKTYALIDSETQLGYFTDANNISVDFINIEEGIQTLQYHSSPIVKGSTVEELTPGVLGDDWKEGHSLKYYSDELMTEEFDFNQQIMGYTKIYTKWEVNKYHVSFVDRDGVELSGTDYDYGTVSGGITLPSDPKREGYTFNGWEGIPDTVPATGVIVTAQYEINQYTITFVKGNGEPDEVITDDYGIGITAPENPIRKGYNFVGWDIEIPATMPAYNITITAQWEKTGGKGRSGGGGHNNSDSESAREGEKENNEQEQETTPTDNQKNEAETQVDNSTQSAHDWSYKNGLTKYSDAGAARLGDSLTRSEMAKLSSIFATKVLGQTPDESKQSFCSQFADISKLNEEMRDYVIKACELGYMGYQSNGIDELVNFRPYSPVTVAEASVIVSRMMWGNQNASSGKNWYKGHLYAAYNHGLLDDIRNPYRNITRGETFEMFYRTSQAK